MRRELTKRMLCPGKRSKRKRSGSDRRESLLPRRLGRRRKETTPGSELVDGLIAHATLSEVKTDEYLLGSSWTRLGGLSLGLLPLLAADTK